jgi:hypothetical protein
MQTARHRSKTCITPALQFGQAPVLALDRDINLVEN